MKALTLAAAAFFAVAGASYAQEALSTGAVEQLQTLAPTLDVTTLTPIQISEINEAVASQDGLDESELNTIIGKMEPAN
ncbi:hypothetical protein [Falsirhodobacter xinxiangensis]|uniref:hypothetical protein n=1 Tax=Falsirhodobacter xinxiangensis TaxID=2530049 RepID=UPI0010AABA9B|nr:hypothetical protein [Rhodobacter xinxiangensis]